MKYLVMTISLFALMSCNKEKVNKRNLKGCWTHSYEESYDIYRPCDYKEFPPSRYRLTFELKGNNVGSPFLVRC